MAEPKISSFCNFGNCVEVETTPDGSVIVRSRGASDGLSGLTFTREEWTAFVLGVKAGEFDVP